MKLILQAVKALFRKVLAKLSEMEASMNDKVSALEAAVDALTPIVVNVTGNSEEAPVIDKTLDEILALLESGNRVEFHVSGNFQNGSHGMIINHATLQVTAFTDAYITCGAILADNTGIRVYSLTLEPSVTSVSSGYCNRDDGSSFIFFH